MTELDAKLGAAMVKIDRVRRRLKRGDEGKAELAAAASLLEDANALLDEEGRRT